MIVLVTGATGFVAGHLVPRLVSQGHHVVAAGHDPARLSHFPGAQPLLWDLRAPAPPTGLAGLPERIDAVVHLAQANVPFPAEAGAMFAVHVAATQQLLELARARGARRFVFASSGSVYGSGSRPWREDDPTEGTGYYAATKLAAERLIRAYGDLVPYSIFRLFTPYGPGQSGRLVPGLIDRVRRGAPVTAAGGTGPTFNPIFVDHVVDVLAQALAADGSHLLNLGGDEPLSVRQMAEQIGRMVGKAPQIQEAAGSADRVVGDVARLRRLYRLPEPLVPFADGVRAMVGALASPPAGLPAGR
jgi:nucleoside-diphosphate-sugar epimerase